MLGGVITVVQLCSSLRPELPSAGWWLHPAQNVTPPGLAGSPLLCNPPPLGSFLLTSQRGHVTITPSSSHPSEGLWALGSAETSKCSRLALCPLPLSIPLSPDLTPARCPHLQALLPGHPHCSLACVLSYSVPPPPRISFVWAVFYVPVTLLLDNPQAYPPYESGYSLPQGSPRLTWPWTSMWHREGAWEEGEGKKEDGERPLPAHCPALPTWSPGLCGAWMASPSTFHIASLWWHQRPKPACLTLRSPLIQPAPKPDTLC